MSPCNCSGSSRYVHIECLNTWRATNSEYAEKCRECQTPYHWELCSYPETAFILFETSPHRLGVASAFFGLLSGLILFASGDIGHVSEWVDNVWTNSSFASGVSREHGYAVVYSVSFANSIVASLQTVVFLSVALCYINAIKAYVLHIWKSAAIVVTVCQAHFLISASFGYSVPATCVVCAVAVMPVAYVNNILLGEHNRFVSSRAGSRSRLTNRIADV